MRPRASSAAAGAEPGGEDSNATAKPRVVIAGAGIIGSSIAYHLAVNHGYRCTLVDKVGPGAAASGKAAGFLALDWCDGGPLAPLARASFPMHERLARELRIESSYRKITCEAVAVDETLVRERATSFRGCKKLPNVQWADVGAVASRSMGDETTVAQVHPRRLVEAFLRRANEVAGSEVVVGEATEIVYDDDDSIEARDDDKKCVGLRVDGDVIPADVVIVATGPWTNRLLPPESVGGEVLGQKYHAVRIRPRRVLSQAVFFQGFGDPEFYPRPDGDVYVCAYPDAPAAVTEEPGQVEVRPEAVQRLEDVARALSSEMRDPAEAPAALDEITKKKRAELPPPGHRRRRADHGQGSRHHERVRRDRAFLLGHPERARVRRGDGTARRRRKSHRRPRVRALRAETRDVSLKKQKKKKRKKKVETRRLRRAFCFTDHSSTLRALCRSRAGADTASSRETSSPRET